MTPSFHRRIFLLLIAALGLAASVRGAQVIKLGTLVPVGTTYHKTLMTLAESWKRDSSGGVELKVFAGGKLGGEAEMVGLMMQNSLQAAMLTAVGLAEIDKSAAGLQYVPMVFRSLDEVDYVGEKLHPLLEERLAKKGFVVLFWSDAGWIRLFSNKPVSTPADLAKLKLLVFAGDTEQVVAIKSAGLNPIPLETADIVPGLQTGLVDAVCMPPFFALASQVDVRAPHMLRINWAPLVGACVVRKETWDKLSPENQAKFLKAAKATGLANSEAGHRESDEAVVAMGKRGLKVTELSPEDEQKWKTMAEGIYPQIREKMVPAEVFDLTLKYLAEYRAAHTP